MLFPHGGSFSVKTIDYHGTELSVAATSVRQAYALAYKGIWIDPEHTYPTGIVCIYDGHRLHLVVWLLVVMTSPVDSQVTAPGYAALRAEIDAHHCDGQKLAIVVKD